MNPVHDDLYDCVGGFLNTTADSMGPCDALAYPIDVHTTAVDAQQQSPSPPRGGFAPATYSGSVYIGVVAALLAILSSLFV